MEQKNIPELFGCQVFNEDVMRKRLPREVYESLICTMDTGGEIDASIADAVASAMKDWAIEQGATHYTHWFQPLTGMTAEKHDSFISSVGNCKVVMDFSGKCLIKGESDASSFPSGGLRSTFEARGYTMWDPGSYAFVRDGSLYIPTAFCSYTGDALDTKTPLLRSMDALSAQTLRILRLFGDTATERVAVTVGAEQEYFIIDRKMYELREDLMFTGRTLFGAPAPKGQELEDHYFGPLKTRIRAYMADVDEELWKLGINSKTKHNEAAPAQHELAPIFAKGNMAVDQNLLTMEVMKLVAERHDLICLLHEKPYAGVNGSGKHNNWSICTDRGKNLLDPGKTPEENLQFLLFLAAVVRAVDEYQELLRVSVAHAGNDHRLGSGEAPPAIVSMFIGDDLDELVDAIVAGQTLAHRHRKVMNLGVPSVPTIRRDRTDRNRTSPFAFTGNKFEFRMLGSSQNIAMPNVVLNTAVARVLSEFADELTGKGDLAEAVTALIRKTFINHRRIIFNGNGYSEEWEKEAERRGLANLKTSVDAYRHFTDEKNIALFTEMGVMSRTEILSRAEILFENYAKVIHIEAETMLRMLRRDVLPAVGSALGDMAGTIGALQDHVGIKVNGQRRTVERLAELSDRAYAAVDELQTKVDIFLAAEGAEEKAAVCADTIVPAMAGLRAVVDEMETICPADFWPYPTYAELIFRV
ncbi:MAG: glutamine synthetase III [Clostridia bacterium]|nr:glutamine synthetase III [Clostridia bacterium]